MTPFLAPLHSPKATLPPDSDTQSSGRDSDTNFSSLLGQFDQKDGVPTTEIDVLEPLDPNQAPTETHPDILEVRQSTFENDDAQAVVSSASKDSPSSSLEGLRTLVDDKATQFSNMPVRPHVENIPAEVKELVVDTTTFAPFGTTNASLSAKSGPASPHLPERTIPTASERPPANAAQPSTAPWPNTYTATTSPDTLKTQAEFGTDGLQAQKQNSREAALNGKRVDAAPYAAHQVNGPNQPLQPPLGSKASSSPTAPGTDNTQTSNPVASITKTKLANDAPHVRQSNSNQPHVPGTDTNRKTAALIPDTVKSRDTPAPHHPQAEANKRLPSTAPTHPNTYPGYASITANAVSVPPASIGAATKPATPRADPSAELGGAIVTQTDRLPPQSTASYPVEAGTRYQGDAQQNLKSAKQPGKDMTALPTQTLRQVLSEQTTPTISPVDAQPPRNATPQTSEISSANEVLLRAQKAATATSAVTPTPDLQIAPEKAEGLIRFDAPGPVSDRPFAPTSAPQALHGTPEQARHIAQQLATAVPTTPPGTTEITLHPEELGRVRMTLTLQDGAMTLLINAERPETTDLMRRHIDQLIQTYRQMGFDTLNLGFAGTAQHNAQQLQQTHGRLEDQPPDEITPDAPPPSVTTATERLDLRM